MRFSKQFIVVLLLGLPGLVLGELAASGLPATSTWYFHADFDEMRRKINSIATGYCRSLNRCWKIRICQRLVRI